MDNSKRLQSNDILPYFTVIIPTHNRKKLLSRAIESVLSQSFKNFELIIIDDGSSDGTIEFLNTLDDNRITSYRSDGEERSYARNLGINKSRGNYVCFLDDDDEYQKEYLNDFYTYYENTGNKSYILRTGFIKKEKHSSKRSTHYIKEKHKNPVNFFSNNMCGVWSLAVPREYLIDNTFPESFPHWQDTHLILRLLSKYPFHQLPSYNYIYNIYDNMGSRMAMTEENIDHRLKLNIDAVNHLFDNYGSIVQPHLKSNTRNKILAGKYLHFASGALFSRQRKKGISLFKKSLSIGIFKNFYKYYILIPLKILGIR